MKGKQTLCSDSEVPGNKLIANISQIRKEDCILIISRTYKLIKCTTEINNI